MREASDEDLSNAMPKIMARVKMLGTKIDRSYRKDLDDLLKDFRQRQRLHGIDFPALVHVIIAGHVYIFRADRERSDIEKYVVNIVRDNPNSDMKEIAVEFGRAYPHIRSIVQ